MKSRLISVVSAILLLVGLGGSANAALITFGFEGVVNNVDPIHEGTFYNGQLISGSYTFESSTQDVDGRVYVGDYQNAIMSYNISIGDYSLRQEIGYNTIFIDYQPDLNSELYEVISDVSGPIVNGLDPYRFDVFLYAQYSNPLTSDELPDVPPELALFGRNTDWVLTFDQPYLISGEITSLTYISSVPIPAAVWLFGSGLIAFIWAGKYRIRKP